MRIAVALALLLVAVAGEARTPRRVCRVACRDAIALCVDAGSPRRGCRRRLVRDCRRRGLAVCEIRTEPTVTTTSVPETSSTTMPTGPTVNGCNAAIAMDLRGETDVTVQFGVGFDIFDYAPECILVSSGTRVTFAGASFYSHPLVGGEIVGNDERPDAASPFGRTDAGSSRTFELDIPGIYGYYCDNHGVAFRMWGAVIVAP